MAKFIKNKSEEFNKVELPQKDLQSLLPPIHDRLSQKEVADLFGTSVQTIINWKKKKILPYFQIGKRPIFSKKQLSLIASQNQNLLK